VPSLFACQDVNRDFLLAWLAESDDNVVKTILSKDHLTYHEAKENIQNLPSNYRSPSGASSKNSLPQHEANAVSSSNKKKEQEKQKRSSYSSNAGSKECDWCRRHSPGTAFGHIWIQCKELNARGDRNGSKPVAPIQQVANTESSNPSNWFFDTGESCHRTLGRNCFKSVSSVQGNIVLADKTKVEYTGISSVRCSHRLPSGEYFCCLVASSSFCTKFTEVFVR
jgi:hypothetical protein